MTGNFDRIFAARAQNCLFLNLW